MTTPTKIFNSHFKEMYEDILYIFPNHKPLSKAQYTIELLLKTKPNIIIKFWKLFSLKYETNIESDGLNFFIQHDFKEDVKQFNAEYILEYVKEMWELIHQMTDDNKEKMLGYIHNLNKISQMYKR